MHVVTTNYKKDGSKFRNFLTLAPLKDEVTGKVTHFCAILNDVGEIYRRRKIRKDNEIILKEALDDITVGSDVSMPTTLSEALPADIEKRNKDPRAIVVTEATGKFNMIGCNKAWEVRLYDTYFCIVFQLSMELVLTSKVFSLLEYDDRIFVALLNVKSSERIPLYCKGKIRTMMACGMQLPVYFKGRRRCMLLPQTTLRMAKNSRIS